jgi:UDP:flavonoid glycosyltransferase YjiC (YdhE family)
MVPGRFHDCCAPDPATPTTQPLKPTSPYSRDQLRCAAVGCALTVNAEQRTPDTIRLAVRTVLAEPSYRLEAHRLQAEIRTLPSMDTAVGLLERLANRRTSPEPEPLQ